MQIGLGFQLRVAEGSVTERVVGWSCVVMDGVVEEHGSLENRSDSYHLLPSMLAGGILVASDSLTSPGTLVRHLPVIRVGIEMTIADHLRSCPSPDSGQFDYRPDEAAT